MKLITTSARTLLAGMTGELPTGNLVWVDLVNGSDPIASRGRMDLPFQTLAAAQTAAAAGDTIVVLPGTYQASDLGKNGVNWFFMTGAIVQWPSGTEKSIFKITSTMSFSVGGYGEFLNEDSGANSCGLDISASTGTISFTCQKIACSAFGVRVLSGAILTLVADTVESIDFDNAVSVNHASAKVSVKARLIKGGADAAIKLIDGTLNVTADAVEGYYGLNVSGGNGLIVANKITATEDYGVLYNAGTLTIQGARIESQKLLTTARAVYLAGGATSGNAALRLVRCTLIVKASGSPLPTASISAVTSTRRVAYYGECLANVASASITEQVSTPLKVSSNIE